MFRVPFLAVLSGSGIAQVAHLDLTALEEFSADFDVGSLWHDRSAPNAVRFLSQQPGAPQDHGTIAIHARNLQLKLDNHMILPPGMWTGGPTGPNNPILAQLGGTDVHEELHINGATGQASFHVDSAVLQVCIQIDQLPPVAQIAHDQISAQLQQAEQISQMVEAVPVTLQLCNSCASSPANALIGPPLGPHHRSELFIFNDESQPVLVTVDPGPAGGPALKFSNYTNTVGNQFEVRACEVESNALSQSLLASDPEVRQYISSRIAEHQSRLQALLEPAMLNTRFNFIPLAIKDLMMVPAGQPCSNDMLTEVSPRTLSSFEVVVMGACSFVMGMIVTRLFHKKSVDPARYEAMVSA